METGRRFVECGAGAECAHDNPCVVYFSGQSSTCPQLLLGLSGLDIDAWTNRRIAGVIDAVTNDVARFSIQSWNNTKLYAASFSWLKVPASDTDLQCGFFDTEERYPSYQPTLDYIDQKIHFKHRYQQAPKVVAWLHKLDTNCSDLRVTVLVTDVSETGFTLRVGTWGGPELYSAGVSWFAYPSLRTDIASGDFVSENDQQREHCNRVAFRDAQFRDPPRVFVALKHLDFGHKHNMRIRPISITDITADGMTWHLDTWEDTVMNRVAAVYIAFAS